MGVTKGALAALVADAAPSDSRGSAYGIFNFASGLALLTASALFGVLCDRSGPGAAFFASALFAAAAIASLLPFRHRLMGRAVKKTARVRPNCKKFGRKEVATEMTPDQIAEKQRMTREWKPK